MEKLHKTARGHYNAGTESIRTQAQNLFSVMDKNGDGKVSLFEFMNFLKGKAGSEIYLKKYFDVVDINRSGDLDFWEAVTFYYLITVVQPPFCDNCSDVLLEKYFTCTTCFTSDASFDLCTNCYNKTHRNHLHKGFWDLNSLVAKQVRSAMGQPAVEQSKRSGGLESTLEVAKAGVEVAHQYFNDQAADPSSSSSLLDGVSSLDDVRYLIYLSHESISSTLLVHSHPLTHLFGGLKSFHLFLILLIHKN